MVTGFRRKISVSVVCIGDGRSLLLCEMVVTLNITRRQNPQEPYKNLYNFVTFQVFVVMGIEFIVLFFIWNMTLVEGVLYWVYLISNYLTHGLFTCNCFLCSCIVVIVLVLYCVCLCCSCCYPN